MRRTTVALIWTVALMLFAGVTGCAQDIVLADGSKTAYSIVISKGVDPGTKAVAEDFAKILNEMTGVTFPVVTDDTEAGGNEIIVGENNSRLAGQYYDDMHQAAKIVEASSGTHAAAQQRVSYAEAFQAHYPQVSTHLPITQHSIETAEGGWKKGLKKLRMIAPYIKGVQQT